MEETGLVAPTPELASVGDNPSVIMTMFYSWL